jgi:hypothetical protein
MSVSELARNYGVSLNSFADDVLALLARLDADPPPARLAARRREVCAAVSAAMTFALDASNLTPEERATLDPLLREVLLPFWNKHCSADADAGSYIAERSTYYLSNRVPGSQVKTAVSIVSTLLDVLGLPEERKIEVARLLTPSFAHRMVTDLYHINDVRTRFGLQLSLLALLTALLQMTLSSEAVVRVLRLG